MTWEEAEQQKLVELKAQRGDERRKRREAEKLRRRWYVFAKFTRKFQVVNGQRAVDDVEFRWCSRGDGAVVRLEYRSKRVAYSYTGPAHVHDVPCWLRADQMKAAAWGQRLRSTGTLTLTQISPSEFEAMLIAHDSWLERGGGAHKITLINKAAKR